MKIEEELLFGYQVKEDLLLNFCFKKEKDKFIKTYEIMNGDFELIISIKKGKLVPKMIDKNYGDEYSLFTNEYATGEFVGKLKDEYRNIILEIRNKCYRKSLFLDAQAERVAKYIKDNYGDEPEFPWKKYPYFGIFRNKINKKRYGCIMNVEDNKLAPNTKGRTVINLKADKSIFDALLCEENIFPGWHMNKKAWISVSLSDYFPDEYVFSLVDMSYKTIRNLNSKKK